MNGASTPEFKAILTDLYSSRKYKTSGEVLKKAWQIYREKYGGSTAEYQRKCPTCRRIMVPGEAKHYHGNPQKDFYLVLETSTDNVVKAFQREKNAKTFLRRLSAKDGVGSYYIQLHSQWKKQLSGYEPSDMLKQAGYSRVGIPKNPRKKQPRRTCKACGALMGKGPVCLSCLNKNPKETNFQKIARYEKLQKHYRKSLLEAEKIGDWGEASKIKKVLSELEPFIEKLVENRLSLRKPLPRKNPKTVQYVVAPFVQSSMAPGNKNQQIIVNVLDELNHTIVHTESIPYSNSFTKKQFQSAVNLATSRAERVAKRMNKENLNKNPQTYGKGIRLSPQKARAIVKRNGLSRLPRMGYNLKLNESQLLFNDGGSYYLVGEFNDKEFDRSRQWNDSTKNNPIAVYNPPSEPYPTQRYYVSKKGMKKGYWKVVDSATGNTERTFDSKKIAETVAEDMSASKHYPVISGQRVGKPFLDNPPSGKPLPMSIIEIRYQRTGGEYKRDLFKHTFKHRPKVYGLPDGSILIKGSARLWGTAD